MTRQSGAQTGAQAPFGAVLRRLRHSAGLTQTELAHKAHFSESFIRRLELGTRMPREASVNMLAYALELDAAEREVLRTVARGQIVASPEVESSHQLPTYDTAFVGRASEERRLLRLFVESGRRAVLITGPPGVGKSRFAVHVADKLLHSCCAEVIFVRFDENSEAHVAGAWVTAFTGIDESVPTLLVLDGLDLVGSINPSWERILRGLPKTRILATSTAEVDVPGFETYPFGPMLVPGERDASIKTCLGYDAVALFVSSACSVDPRFKLTAANSPTVIQLCAEREGLAACIEEVGRRAGGNAPLLTGTGARVTVERAASGGFQNHKGSSTAEDRHASRLRLAEQPDLDGMEARLYRQFARLDRMSAWVFEQLGAFVGRWTLEASAAVCFAPADGSSIEDIVSDLERHNLVTHTDEGDWRMLTPIRLYASRRLEASAAVDAVRLRHAEYHARLLERLPQRLDGMRDPDLRIRMRPRYGDVREALGWCRESSHYLLLARLTLGVWPLWYIDGHVEEAGHWVRLALATVTDTVLRLRLLDAASNIAYSQRDLEWMAESVGERIELHGEEFDVAERRAVTRCAAWVAMNRGDFAGARHYLEVDIHGADLGQPVSDYMSQLLMEADLERFQGRYIKAESLYREIILIASRFPEYLMVYLARLHLAQAYIEWSRLDDAEVTFQDLATSDSNGPGRRFLAHALEGLAYIEVTNGNDPARAARMLGAGTALRDRLGFPREPEMQDMVAAIEPLISGWAREFRAGRQMDVQDMILLTKPVEPRTLREPRSREALSVAG